MATIQTSDELQAILGRLLGEEVAALQVVGINSLKSVAPMPSALASETIESVGVADRLVTVATPGYEVTLDLQRTGKLVWLQSAEPYVVLAGAARPTLRLMLVSGEGLDVTEPTKTKRVTVTISTRA